MVLLPQVQCHLKQAAVYFQYIGGGYKTYSLAFKFILHIHPSGEVLYHQATIEHRVAYAGEYFVTCHMFLCRRSGLTCAAHVSRSHWKTEYNIFVCERCLSNTFPDDWLQLQVPPGWRGSALRAAWWCCCTMEPRQGCSGSCSSEATS